jgi:hypothetical protein
MADDTYTVELGRKLKTQFIVKESHPDIYCDMLQDFVDQLVERKS